MTIYIILIAFLNLCVGYFTAVHLGFGRKWWATGSFHVALPQAVDDGEQEATPTLDTSTASSPAAEERASAAQVEPQSEPISEEPLASAAFEALASASGVGEDGLRAPEEPSDEAPETPADKTKVEADAATSDVDDEAYRLVETCVADFKQELGHYRQQLDEIETRVRGASEAPQAEELQQCVEVLKSANSEFLDMQGGTSRRLKSQKDHGPLADVAAGVGRAIAEHEALVESSNANIEQLDPENELETGFQQLLGETSLLSNNADQVDASLDSAKQSVDEVLRDQGPQPIGTDNAYRDDEDVTESLNAWWSDDPERTREITAGVVSVDKTAQLKEQIGADSSDKLLDAVSTIVQDAVGKMGPVVRQSPHVFVVLFHDTGAREATHVVEQIRQTVAAAKFAYRQSHVPVTVSCAITPARVEDTAQTLLDRVDATLQESSRYGENQTFLHEGKHAAPVVPPQLDVDEVRVRL